MDGFLFTSNDRFCCSNTRVGERRRFQTSDSTARFFLCVLFPCIHLPFTWMARLLIAVSERVTAKQLLSGRNRRNKQPIIPSLLVEVGCLLVFVDWSDEHFNNE